MPVVTVNHQEKEIEENASLSALLTQLELSTQGIAIAVNNTVISKADWETTALKEADTVTIIKATQGG